MRVIAVLCLLLFQVQVFAASALGCRHNDASVSPFHHCAMMIAQQAATKHAEADAGFARDLAADAGADSTLGDCQKCALNLCAASWHLLGSSAEVTPHPGFAVLASLPSRHFYHHAPERFLKPPIALQA